MVASCFCRGRKSVDAMDGLYVQKRCFHLSLSSGAMSMMDTGDHAFYLALSQVVATPHVFAIRGEKILKMIASMIFKTYLHRLPLTCTDL